MLDERSQLGKLKRRRAEVELNSNSSHVPSIARPVQRPRRAAAACSEGFAGLFADAPEFGLRDPNRVPDPHVPKLPALAQPVHRGRADPQPLSHLLHRQQPFNARQTHPSRPRSLQQGCSKRRANRC